jgi:hypothetical protein
MNLRHLYPTLGGLDGFNAMLAVQGGVCKICSRPPRDKKKRLHVDHCHKTGKIRGLLCLHCNVMIGKAEDDPKRLERAAAYLTSQS